MNDVIGLLKSHRSIRKFSDQQIPHELFLELIRCGQQAATSNHVQACTVIHVTRQDVREQMAELAGGQHYIKGCSHFLVFCADTKRSLEAAGRAGADVTSGTTEQLLVATVDTALFAQNVAIAAESSGLGICYIGGLRNDPQRVSELLGLPDLVYPVFGMCLGYAEQDPETKPRLPLSAVLKTDEYSDAEDKALVGEFDETMQRYYQQRSGGTKDSNWSLELRPLFSEKLRMHMKGFLQRRGLMTD